MNEFQEEKFWSIVEILNDTTATHREEICYSTTTINFFYGKNFIERKITEVERSSEFENFDRLFILFILSIKWKSFNW